MTSANPAVDADFDACFNSLIDFERGFTNDPKDKGNWTGGAIGSGQCRGTKYGISAASYPDLAISLLTLDEARAIYRRDFWDKAGIPKVPAELHSDLFDMAVNSGPGNARRCLQRALGVMDDGVFGPITTAALAHANAFALLARFNGFRLQFMTESSAWESYSKGWARRIATLLQRVSG